MLTFKIYQTLSLALSLYTWGMFIYILMSWIPGARESAVGEVFSKLYEPFLEFFRKIIPPIGMIDISPLVAIILLNIAQRGLAQVFITFFNL